VRYGSVGDERYVRYVRYVQCGLGWEGQILSGIRYRVSGRETELLRYVYSYVHVSYMHVSYMYVSYVSYVLYVSYVYRW
jgi:hypothetical protein